MKKLLASLILLIMVINLLPAASSMSDGVSVEYIPPAYSLGIGISPTSKLHVNGTTATKGFSLNGNTMSIPVATQGDILFAKVAGSFSVLNNGTTAKVLTVNGNTLSWKSPSAAGATNIEGLSDGRSNVYNVYLGNGAGAAPDTGASYSTGVGIGALKNNTSASGLYNSAFGYQALNGNTTGRANTASGTTSLYSNTTGDQNTATGVNSLRFNTTGYSNTASGTSSLSLNTTGAQNVAIGAISLYSNTTGDHNAASGTGSLYSNTTGVQNTASGAYSLRYPVTGSNNTAVGFFAGEGNGSQSFSNGTFLGYNTGLSLTTGSSNVLIGFQAGDAITSGAKNIVIGYDVDAPSNTASNQLNIGDSIYANGMTAATKKIGIAKTNPANTLHVNGQIMMANGTTACSAAIEGSQRYNSVAKAMQFCNGTSWSAFGASGTVPSFHVHRNGVDQPVANTTAVTNGDWTHETFDNTNAFDLNTNRFTPQVAGKYLIIWHMSIVDNSGTPTNDANCLLYKNTTQISLGFAMDESSDPPYITASCSTIVELNGSSDYIIARLNFISSHATNVLEGAAKNGTYMTGVKVSD